MSSLAGLLLLAGPALSGPGAPTRKPTIAVAIVGDSSGAPLDPLGPILRDAFGAEVVGAPRVELPRTAFDPSRRQWRSTGLLDVLAAAKKPAWDRLLGIADVDLYAPGLNFVFGEADPGRGIAVFSVARLRSAADDALFRRREATEAIHELGHAFGLSHCENPDCVMWFSNTLAESDRKGTRFCADHAPALADAISRLRR